MSFYEKKKKTITLTASLLWMENVDTDNLGCLQCTPVLPFTSYKTLAKLLNLSKPQFYYYKVEK